LEQETSSPPVKILKDASLPLYAATSQMAASAIALPMPEAVTDFQEGTSSQAAVSLQTAIILKTVYLPQCGKYKISYNILIKCIIDSGIPIASALLKDHILSKF
jgi:hypothetical protein